MHFRLYMFFGKFRKYNSAMKFQKWIKLTSFPILLFFVLLYNPNICQKPRLFVNKKCRYFWLNNEQSEKLEGVFGPRYLEPGKFKVNRLFSCKVLATDHCI